MSNPKDSASPVRVGGMGGGGGLTQRSPQEMIPRLGFDGDKRMKVLTLEIFSQAILIDARNLLHQFRSTHDKLLSHPAIVTLGVRFRNHAPRQSISCGSISTVNSTPLGTRTVGSTARNT
jgi:hypothetical protein